MDTKNFVYLGSMSRNRSYGVMIDRFRARFIKTPTKRKGDVIRTTLEIGELVIALGMESLLKGLWLVNAELFEKDEARATELIKIQLAATLNNGILQPAISQPPNAPSEFAQDAEADRLAPDAKTNPVIELPQAVDVVVPVAKPTAEIVNIPPAPDDYVDSPVAELSVIVDEPAAIQPESPLKGFIQMQ
jgi:hypothetical protein